MNSAQNESSELRITLVTRRKRNKATEQRKKKKNELQI